MTYTQHELVAIAKRENNKKRTYLLVNPLQGKHIPVFPKDALTLFQCLSQSIFQLYGQEQLLFIGFAETATAIGSAVCISYPMDCYYIQTTRETYSTADYLFFTESHSHATEQKLICNQLPALLDKIDRIVFIEDEVTTGNTIYGIIDVLKKTYSNKHLKFGIASLLNSMTEIRIKELEQQDILCTYILKLPSDFDYTDYLEGFSFEPSLKKQLPFSMQTSCDFKTNLNTLSKGAIKANVIPMKQNPRFGITKQEYLTLCQNFYHQIKTDIMNTIQKNDSILVLGAEEFMYPALFVANQLEAESLVDTVHFHATTRSPILPSREPNYPLHSRYQLYSLYDKERITFIYNLTSYDKVILIHDSHNYNEFSIYSLCSALLDSKCYNIQIYHWFYCR